MDILLEASWKKALQKECAKDYFIELRNFVHAAYESGRPIYPPLHLLFHAFELTPFDRVRVVLMGQDPYHGKGQAHGLSFSVPAGVPVPPSLRNIFKEITNDVSTSSHKDGNLEGWARQGVLLLNATMTVGDGTAGSHKRKGWEQFTDAVIKIISDKKENIVFLLWGKNAEEKRKYIDERKHLILTAPHPSPLSAHRGFFGSGHFSKANQYLVSHGHAPILW